MHFLWRTKQNSPPKENIKPETKDIVNSTGSNEKYHTKSEYTDSMGKRLIIQNSWSRGIKYTDPNGHPTDEEAVRLNAIQEELETLLKKKHTVHSIARVTRNGFRDIMIYIDKPKLTQEEINTFFQDIQKDREVNFGIHKDLSWNAVSGFIK